MRVKVFRNLFILIVSYVISWTVSYVFINGLDFNNYFGYLELAWTFNGFVRPFYTWIGSLVGLPFCFFIIKFVFKPKKLP